MRVYVYRKWTGELSEPVSYRQVMTVAATRIAPGKGPFSITVDGERIAKGATRKETLGRVGRWLKREEGLPGPTIRVRNKAGKLVFMAREAVPAVHIIDTNGNAKIDKVWSYAKAEFPNIWFLGAYVCKYVSGTSVRSQHSYGNALDIGAKDMQALFAIASWLVAHADTLDVYTVIVGDRLWRKGEGWRSYGGVYHHHVHVDCDPNYSGGCGVKG